MDNGSGGQSGVRNILGDAYELAYKGWIKVWRDISGRQEIVEKKNAAAFLVYNRDKRTVAMVCQKRPATTFVSPDEMILEVPAGHIDEDEPVAKAMAREAREEIGLLTDLKAAQDRFELINSGTPLFTSPGIITEHLYLGYGEFSHDEFDHSRTHFGLSEEKENTEIIWVSIEDLNIMLYNDLKTFALVQWFLLNIYPQLTTQKENK